ncbi:MAG TPA: hypothetical protein VN786_12560 [Acidimicrobiales bacterium]|nr:hypothetical protein [Acidimicrobiales bacterium]
MRLPERRATIWALILAVLVAAICWYFGVDVWHSVLLGSVLTTLGLISMVGTADGDLGSTDWRGGASANRDGARGEVAELSWSLRTNYGRVNHKAVLRVRQLARHRLAQHQLDLNDPADRSGVELLIGRSAYAVLVLSDRRPLLRSFLHCLEALDAMDGMPRTTPPSRRRRQRPPRLRTALPGRSRER